MASLLTNNTIITNSLASVSNVATSLSNLIVATPNTVQGYQPQNQIGSTSAIASSLGLNNILNLAPKSLLFHYEGEQTASLESDITDHFIEDNTAIQDQIALRPVIVTTHGFIGELNNVPPAALVAVQKAAQALTSLTPYTPGLSASAIQAYNSAFQAYQAAQSLSNAASSAWSSLTNTGTSVIGAGGALSTQRGQNQQQVLFQQFYGYWFNRILFTVQTPWTIIQNMAIYKFRAIQSEETNVISDFEVTFKQIRTSMTAVNAPVQSSVRAAQSSTVVNQGTKNAQAGAPAVTSSVNAVQSGG